MSCEYCNIEIKEGDYYWTVAVGRGFLCFCSKEHIRQQFGDIKEVGEVIDKGG